MRAIDPLIQLLYSGNFSVIVSAIDALVEFRDSRIVPHLIPLLETGKDKKSGDGLFMRITRAEFVAEKLRTYDTDEAIDALKEWDENEGNNI